MDAWLKDAIEQRQLFGPVHIIILRVICSATRATGDTVRNWPRIPFKVLYTVKFSFPCGTEFTSRSQTKDTAVFTR